MVQAALSNTTRAFAPLGRIVHYHWREYRKQSHWRLRIVALAAFGLSFGSIAVLVLT
jgi:hypothetical protein